MGETPKTALHRYCLLPIAYCRLDAVAHGGNPQDRAASLLPLASCRLDAVAHGGNPQDRAASLLPLASCLQKA
ncbi:MAG: hypothetical protein F6K65_15390 [Moorea sp. SIO3C2]|nr:hypothetical protein [Moorena sp. SIO3C2]